MKNITLIECDSGQEVTERIASVAVPTGSISVDVPEQRGRNSIEHPRQQHSPAGQLPCSQPVARHAPLDASVLNDLSELQQPGAPNLLGSLTDLYLSDAPNLIASMHDALRRDDAGSLQHAAHKLKGSSANLGASRLAEYCKQIEGLARGATLQFIDPRLAAVEGEFRLVCAALRTYCGSQSRSFDG